LIQLYVLAHATVTGL